MNWINSTMREDARERVNSSWVGIVGVVWAGGEKSGERKN
jgi:hypothetical protein